MKKKVLLCILDGWGIGRKNKNNAIHVAKTKNFDNLTKKYGFIKLDASESEVGLPNGQFGNSEVGHMSIGAGRVILQDILRINKAFDNGFFKEHKLIRKIKETAKRIHLVGLLSDGGVHGHQNHLLELIDILKDCKVLIHGILDGRDTSPLSGVENVKLLQKKIKNYHNVKIASLSGRFYAMDRDNRWERIEKAYKAIIEGNLKKTKCFIRSIENSYADHVTDEFFPPLNHISYKGAQDGDSFIITNYRDDRVREINSSIFDKNFDEFKRKNYINFFSPTSMVEYSKRIKKIVTPLLESHNVKNSLGEIISKSKLNQLRIAETEKYAHVTYFFNGGVEDSFDQEDRVLIPSPRVDTYDTKPEMAAFEVTTELVNRISKKHYDFIVTNFANTDMVGHTGNLLDTIKAVETLYKCLGILYKLCKKNGYTLIVTSDHGNADMMLDNNRNMPCTTHSLNPVPFIICGPYNFNAKKGRLSDIAPTILKLLGISRPNDMNGRPLIK